MKPVELYQILFSHFGRLQWWPVDQDYHQKQGSDPRFEIIVGAILTQNTAWSNVETALNELKQRKLLSIDALSKVESSQLTQYIKSSGFFNQKAQRLQLFSAYLVDTYQGDISTMFATPLSELRQELLNLNGIGPETADSILLYAGNHPVFVVDAYTKRLCQRLPIVVNNIEYESIQSHFEQQLTQVYEKNQLVDVYQQFHAAIVEQAKQFCRTKPLCQLCPIQNQCSFQ